MVGRSRALSLVFFICLGFALLFPLFSSCRLTFFAPFLVSVFYRMDLQKSLWIAFGVGLIMDLLSPSQPFGACAFNYSMTALFLYQMKNMFFEERLSTIPLLTAGFALVSTLLQIALFVITKKNFHPSWEWAYTDLIAMPIVDAFFAFFVAYLPIKLILRKY